MLHEAHPGQQCAAPNGARLFSAPPRNGTYTPGIWAAGRSHRRVRFPCRDRGYEKKAHRECQWAFFCTFATTPAHASHVVTLVNTEVQAVLHFVLILKPGQNKSLPPAGKSALDPLYRHVGPRRVLPARAAERARRARAAARRWVQAFSPPLRTLDALHLSIAAGAGAALLTADVQLARAAAATGAKSRNAT